MAAAPKTRLRCQSLLGLYPGTRQGAAIRDLRSPMGRQSGSIGSRALPGTGALRHASNIYRLTKNRPVTISIRPKRSVLVVRCPGPAASWGTFTPNAPSGSDPGGATDVGIDRLGRQETSGSIPTSTATISRPTNGTSIDHDSIHSCGFWCRSHRSLPASALQPGRIHRHASRGDLLKAPAGTIDLYSDMVVARISAVSLPRVSRLPIDLDDNQSFTALRSLPWR